MQVVLLSGVSGSGKSVALRALEDSHFFAVDNLPADLILTLVDYAGSRGEPKVAISADARSRESLGRLPQIVEELGKRGHDVRVIFLDSNDESLVRRFSETRRPHPLAREGQALAEAIAEERRVLAWLAEIGHRIDTSALLPSQLRGWVQDLVVTDRQRLLTFESFGFGAAHRWTPTSSSTRAACCPTRTTTRSCARSPATIPRWSSSSSARRRRTSWSRTSSASCSAGSRASRSTSAPRSPWRSAARAGGIARCTSPSSSRRDSAASTRWC
jgi:hypothetical protein